MIKSDQPSLFPDSIIVRTSSVSDGTMLDRTKNIHHPNVVSNRREFCQKVGIDYSQCVYQLINYGPEQSYQHVAIVTKKDTTVRRQGVAADALITDLPGVGLFLPVADCVATVIYDRENNKLALLHLGRHATVKPLLKNVLQDFLANCDAQDIYVWMSPSAKKQHYAMRYFDKEDDPAWQPFIEKSSQGIHLDLPGFNKQVCLDMGVLPANIEVSPIDTFTSSDYFSHAAGDTDKRFTVLAMIRPL